jgi:phage-related protein
MTRILRILGLLLFVCNFAQAQTPSDKPCNAPVVQTSNNPGTFINNTVSLCCNTYTNFLGTNPTCGTAQTDRDAWFKINGMTAGQQYNFMYIETGNRQTWVEIFELPAGKDCTKPTDFKTVKCARANNVAFYPGSTVSATFIPPSATSTYYARFQRLNVTDESLDGIFSVTKSYPNEEPCGAILLTPSPAQGTNATFGNNITAADWKPEILTGPTCGPNNDVWYKFVATECSMQIFIDNLSQTTYEMQAALLASSDGTCNNLMDVVPCGGLPDQYLDIMLTADNLTVGKTYYVIVDGYAPPYINAIGNFSIEVFKKPNAPSCPPIPSPCDCGDIASCGGSGSLLPNSIAGNAALNAAIANPNANGCYQFSSSAPAPPLCGGNNTVEFCINYKALSSDTLVAFDNVVGKDADCEVLSTKNIAYEEGLCVAPAAPICLDYNKKSPFFKVTPGKNYRFCRQIVTNGADPDCLGKTYKSFCAFMWKIPSNFSMSKTICNGESVKIGNNTYSTSGTYTNVLSNAVTGCDSIVVLNLNVLPASVSNITTSICNGDSYLIGTDKYNKTGTYVAKIKTGNGCDSTINLNLTVLPAKISTQAKTICFGESLTIGNNVYDKSGVYTASVKTNGLSCDSTISLTLTVLPKNEKVFGKTICNGQTYTSVDGTVYDKTGTYEKKYKGKNGCDSFYTVKLLVKPVLTNSIKGGVCEGKSFVFGTQTLTKTGIYTEKFTTGIGCDSTVIIDFKVSNKVEKTTTATTCDNKPYIFGGKPYDKSGTYKLDFPLPGGCDSTATLILTVLPTKKETKNVTICNGESVKIGTFTYNTSGTYTNTIPSKANGCDSVVTLNLTVRPPSDKTESRTICNGASVTVNGKVYTKAGTFPEGKFKDKNGCDSIFTVVISEENIDIKTNINRPACGDVADGSIKIDNPTGADYKFLWSTNATTASITNLKKGTYTVTVTNTKTGCTKVQSIQLEESPAPKVSAVVKGPECDSKANGSITILGPTGTITWTPAISTTTTASNLKSGTYSVVIKDANGCESKETFVLTPTSNITPKITVNPTGQVIQGSDVTLTVDNVPTNGKYNWSNGATTQVIVVKATSKSVTYTVTYTDSNGCTGTASTTIIGKGIDFPKVVIPTDGNEKNTKFRPVVGSLPEPYRKFLIVNRWGEVVCDLSGTIDPAWTGNYYDGAKDLSKPCPADSYVYIVQFAGDETVYSSDFTLVR